jgi:hypothetical protein
VQPGDLVKFTRPATVEEVNQYYLVLEIDENYDWVKLDDDEYNLYHHIKDLTVVSSA